MQVDDLNDFFKTKRPWSKYKDLILDYYLVPYLAKVAKLRKPLAVVDCFAGPGCFDDGQRGSPLIISDRLLEAQGRGAEVLGVFIENDDKRFERLKACLARVEIPAQIKRGDFRNHVDELSALATTHSLFVYLDPIRPTHLLFDDLASVYDKLQRGQSVETLINFMSSGFVRIAQGIAGSKGGAVLQEDIDHPQVARCDEIAGGGYWREVIVDPSLSQAQRVDAVANGYAQQLSRWFKWVLKYPIRERYQDELPKYHLVFASRHPDAVELMNRAMVTARRKFVGARFVEGMLFPNQPEKEIIQPDEIEEAVLKTARTGGRTNWKLLRVHTTMHYPCLYTESEINQAIKRAIQRGTLNSTALGTKIQDEAPVWVKDQ